MILIKIYLHLFAFIASSPTSPYSDNSANLPCLPIDVMGSLMSHDAGSAYYPKDALISRMVRTQSLDFYDQLDAGIRSFDLRPIKTPTGEIQMHHGLIPVRYSLDNALNDIFRWTTANKKNQKEVIILYISHYSDISIINNLSVIGRKMNPLIMGDPVKRILTEHGIPFITNCNDLSELNSCTIQDRSAVFKKVEEISSINKKFYGKHRQNLDPKDDLFAGHVLAVFECMDENFDKTIGCYTDDPDVKKCEFKPNFEKLEKDLDSVGHKKLFLTQQKHPDHPGYSKPRLQMSQAHWQYSWHRFKVAKKYKQTTLTDVEESKLNEVMAKRIDGITDKIEQDLPSMATFYINFFEVDDIASGGTELATAFDKYKAAIDNRLQNRFRMNQPMKLSKSKADAFKFCLSSLHPVRCTFVFSVYIIIVRYYTKYLNNIPDWEGLLGFQSKDFLFILNKFWPNEFNELIYPNQFTKDVISTFPKIESEAMDPKFKDGIDYVNAAQNDEDYYTPPNLAINMDNLFEEDAEVSILLSAIVNVVVSEMVHNIKVTRYPLLPKLNIEISDIISNEVTEYDYERQYDFPMIHSDADSDRILKFKLIRSGVYHPSDEFADNHSADKLYEVGQLRAVKSEMGDEHYFEDLTADEIHDEK